MAARPLPPRDLVRQLLDYDPATGVLTWHHRPREMFPTTRSYKWWNTRFAGKIAGSLSNGYIGLRIFHISYRAHRVIWLHHHGEPVPNEIDHADGIGSENLANNMRDASRGQNMANTPTRKDNRLGLKGVREMSNGRFQARITRDGKQTYLGCFDTPEEASAARYDAAIQLHGEFARRE